jgi:membrane protein implicated in regulation of membrane protease activity
MRALVTLGIAVLLALPAGAADQQKQATKAAAPAAALSVTGIVLETMDSGGYTYMKLKTDQGEVWSAVNQTKVKKGQTVTIGTPMYLDNFQSKTLNRTFDRIIFGTLAASGAAAPQGAATASSGGELPPGHPAMGGATKDSMAAQHSAAANPQADAAPIKVARAEGPTGKTVAELYAQRATLKDKEVAVRGKVVKVTPEVMGKNWLHLHDGSGSAAKKDNDITVTTSGTAAVGDVVLVKGIVHLDRDFGAGYTYSVIIEDAKVSK